MSASKLIAALHASLEHLPAGGIAVAFSGGMDSTALLHALAHIPATRERGLRAIHVDHGLHGDSAHWAQHCRDFAADLGIALEVVAVDVARAAGSGIEDAARRARRAAFTAALANAEILALAQHRDDQAETILLKLLRGAGPEGLGGMRVLRPFGRGYLWRPLLELPRAALADYARAHGLQWIEDPSNANTHLRRNFLRAEILPRLVQRWPDAQAALAHSATWARNAADLIEAQSTAALAELRGADNTTLDWRGWLDLPDALRDPVLRRWLRALQLDEPAHFHVHEIERQLREAPPDRSPCVCWANTEVRRYRSMLFAMRPVTLPPKHWQTGWDGAPLALPAGGTLALVGDAATLPPTQAPALTIRYRHGGERLRPAGKPHTRDLRLLLQEAGMPPWQRARVPLIYADAGLIAAGNLFLSDAALELCARLRVQIVWTRAPSIDSAAALR